MPDESASTIQLRCPTCGARQAWSETCRRCRCDLGLVVGLLRDLQRMRSRCLQQLRDRDYDRAAATARRCCQLDAGPENRRLRAVAEACRGRFEAAERMLSG